MDTTQTITHLGLCAGYCGIELGLKRVLPTLRTVALCEIEAFACANLVAKMEEGFLDPAPIWTDLKSFPWADFRDRVDILTGGYPCQPFSAAGNRLGKDDPRHLWPFIADGVRLLQPRVCFFENVDGHISLGLREVVEELEGLGYKTTWGIFSASEVGAPHQRKRVFIMSYRNDSGLEGCLSTRVLDSFGREESSNGHFGSSRDNGSKLADTSHSRRRENWLSAEFWSSVSQQSSGHSGIASTGETSEIPQGRAAQDSHVAWPAGPSAGQYNWEPPRVVANAKGKQNRGEQLTGVSTDVTSTSDQMANAKGGDGQRSTPRESGYLAQPDENPNGRQIESPLGRDIDECPDRMDDAELHVTCDNRTDELRLLGNGVVPATAERAFRVLVGQILEKESPL